MSGYMVAMAPCWACKKVFQFDVDRVPSVFVDPLTDKTPDMGGDPDRARREPICPSCCQEVNPRRAAAGLEPLTERPA